MSEQTACADYGEKLWTPIRRPDAASIQRPSILSAENISTGNLISFCIIYKQLSQLTRNQNGPGFTFAVDGDGSSSHHFQCEVPQFRNTDSSAADGLQNQIQLLFSPGCFQEPQVLIFRQFFLLGTVHLQSGQPMNPKKLLMEASMELMDRTAYPCSIHCFL